MMINKMVQIHSGYNSPGGIFIYEQIITGTIVKVNAKSIRVYMTSVKCLTNGEITREYNINQEATFTFWKKIDKQSGTVSVYKNPKYGIIEIVH
jgi:hypothetical protein